jgi:hypothetical protein
MRRRQPNPTFTFSHAVMVAMRQFSQRLETVGSTPDEQLAWLARFVRRDDLDREDNRGAAAAELHAFLLRHYKAWGASVNVIVDHELEQPIAPHDVPTIQEAVRNVLDQLAPDARVAFPQAIGDGVVWRAEHGIVLVTRAPGVPKVLAAVVDLLLAVGPRLHRCERAACRRLFARTRPHQRYCSTTCGGIERVAKWRRGHPDQLATHRHQHYARTVRARLPGARPRRRTKKGS